MDHDPSTSNRFALTAIVFEGSLTAVAIALGWLVGQPPSRTFHFDLRHAALGVAATLPPLGLFWLCLKSPLPPCRAIVRILDETILPPFRDWRLTELAILALLAGLGEEMLFRGVLQAAVAEEIGGPSGVWLGLVIASTLFGLVHAVTPTYSLLSGLIGLYLGWLWLATGNLLTPIIAHAVCDFVALWYLVRHRVSDKMALPGQKP